MITNVMPVREPDDVQSLFAAWYESVALLRSLAIREIAQFKALCPASATLLQWRLQGERT